MTTKTKEGRVQIVLAICYLLVFAAVGLVATSVLSEWKILPVVGAFVAYTVAHACHGAIKDQIK